MWHDIKEDIDSAIDWHKANMPQRIKTLAMLARCDLWFGPTMVDPDTLEASCDESAVAFDFAGACAEIAAWADDAISNVQVEIAYDEETNESKYEYVDCRHTIRKALFGCLTEYL